MGQTWAGRLPEPAFPFESGNNGGDNLWLTLDVMVTCGLCGQPKIQCFHVAAKDRASSPHTEDAGQAGVPQGQDRGPLTTAEASTSGCFLTLPHGAPCSFTFLLVMGMAAPTLTRDPEG